MILHEFFYNWNFVSYMIIIMLTIIYGKWIFLKLFSNLFFIHFNVQEKLFFFFLFDEGGFFNMNVLWLCISEILKKLINNLVKRKIKLPIYFNPIFFFLTLIFRSPSSSHLSSSQILAVVGHPPLLWQKNYILHSLFMVYLSIIIISKGTILKVN